jgi:transcriptional regulator with XRE-family HTH domain
VYFLSNKEFGKYIERLRLEAGYDTREALAKESGVFGTTIMRIEEGRTKKVSPDTLKKLAPFLKVSVHELMKAAGYLSEETSQIKEERADYLTRNFVNEVVKTVKKSDKALSPAEENLVLSIISATIDSINKKDDKK